MRRADVIVLMILALFLGSLTVQWVVHARQVAYGTAPQDAGMVPATHLNFDQEVREAENPVILVFYAGGFSTWDAAFWREFHTKNPQWKLVGMAKGDPIWHALDDGTSRFRAFVWHKELQKASPLFLGPIEMVEQQVEDALLSAHMLMLQRAEGPGRQ